MIDIDQSPIGRTPRSNPATYTGLWGPLRELLAAVPEARLRGYQPGRFSFNVKGGRCEACEGAGIVQIEMHFLPDVYVQCEVCKGQRYNRETLEIHYKGKNVAEILEMTVDEALAFFEVIPSIRTRLQTLQDVGMGYVHLGQPATTLSGGEAQRVKLATELARRATGKTVYILDEPTTGLHFDDVARLLKVLGRLARRGQHGHRDRAQPRRHQVRGLGRRPRSGRRGRRWRPRLSRCSRGRGRGPAVPHWDVPAPGAGPSRTDCPRAALPDDASPHRRVRLTRPYDRASTQFGGMGMAGSGIATAALVVVGILLVVIGVFLAGNLPLIALGVFSLIVGGILSVWSQRKAA